MLGKIGFIVNIDHNLTKIRSDQENNFFANFEQNQFFSFVPTLRSPNNNTNYF